MIDRLRKETRTRARRAVVYAVQWLVIAYETIWDEPIDPSQMPRGTR